MAVTREPLNKRLRAEAEQWSDMEPAKWLLIEAAEALELIVLEVALLLEKRKGEP